MMNARTAVLIQAMGAYAAFGYRLGVSEVQKLAYFLEESGFGPYADVKQVLRNIEGRFIWGYRDRSSKAEIRLLPGATDLATEFLHAKPGAEEHLERVKKLIEGFETPYGMQLLSTVHWVAKHDADVRGDLEVIRERVESWNQRKKDLMKPQHIQKAYSRLEQQGWISS